MDVLTTEPRHIDTEVRREVAHSLWPLNRWGLDPTTLERSKSVRPQSWCRSDSYAELAVSSPAVAEIIAGTHCADSSVLTELDVSSLCSCDQRRYDTSTSNQPPDMTMTIRYLTITVWYLLHFIDIVYTWYA